MTENTFMDAPEGAEEARSRKPLLIAGAGVGLVALAGAGWFLLRGSSSSDDSALPVPHGKPVSKVAPKTTTAKRVTVKQTVKTLPAASTVKIGRDPFGALYIVPVSTGPAAGSTTTTTSGSSSTTPSTTTVQPGTTSGAAYVITLAKVATDPGGAKLFTFTYGTTTKTVLPAQRFGKYGELVVLTYLKNSKGAVTGAVLQVGDDNPITVPVGGKVSVQ